MVDVTLNRSDIKGNLCQISSSYAFWLLIYGGGKLIYETDLVFLTHFFLVGGGLGLMILILRQT